MFQKTPYKKSENVINISDIIIVDSYLHIEVIKKLNFKLTQKKWASERYKILAWK